jgi:hypothetical protein
MAKNVTGICLEEKPELRPENFPPLQYLCT